MLQKYKGQWQDYESKATAGMTTAEKKRWLKEEHESQRIWAQADSSY
jgi:hypothetical protein